MIEEYNNNEINNNYIYDENQNVSKKNKITETFELMLNSNLILSKNSNMIIRRPFNIFQLITQLKISGNSKIKIEIIQKLSWIISRLQINGKIINEKTNLKDNKTGIKINFLNEIINILINNNRDENLVEIFLNFIGILIQTGGVQLDNFFNIFRQLSKMFNNKKLYDSNKFLIYLKILIKLFIKPNFDDIIFPTKFFFFNNYLSEIKINSEVLQNKNISLLKGYTICLWFYIEQINLDSSNKKITDNSILFYLHMNNFVVFELYLKKNKLYYRWYNLFEMNKKKIENENNNNNNLNSNLNINEENINNNSIENNNPFINLNKSQDEIFLCDIDYNKWTYLCFSHKSMTFLQKPQIILFKNSLNSSIVKNYEYPNLNNQKITSIGFFQNFTGYCTSVLMSNDSFIQPNIINYFINFKYGFYNEKNIEELIEYLNQDEIDENGNKNKDLINIKNFFKNSLFFYTPCRYNNNICFDIFDNINAELIQFNDKDLLGGVCIENNYSNKIYLLGGVTMFLPIFEFIFNTKYGTSLIFEQALNLLIVIFSDKNYYEYKQKEKDKKIFFYLTNLIQNYLPELSNNVNLFNKEIMFKLLKLGKILINSEKNETYLLSRQYFKYILFNPKIIFFYDQSIQNEFWNNINELYKEKINILSNIFDIYNILNLIIKLYDYDINLYCCENHYKMLCENYDEKGEKLYNISNPEYLVKINGLINVINLILENEVIIITTQLKKIIPLLSLEICPCMQLIILYIFEKIFGIYEDPNNNKNNIIKKTINNNINNNEIKEFSNESEYINSFIENKGIEHLLYLINISTLDIRFEILKILNFIIINEYYSNLISYNLKKELIPFICTTFFPIKTPLSNIKPIEEKKLYFQTKKSQYIIEKDSLDSLEEDYWKIISSTSLIKNLSIPILYVHEYSNPLNDLYVEKIYTFLLQWLVNKNNIKTENFQLDDNDNIVHEYILNLLLQLIMYSNILLKQKFLTDLYTLTQFNKRNCEIILNNKYFYQWLLDLLLTYQILKDTNFLKNIEDKSGLGDIILNLGIKLHTIIIINTIIYEHEEEKTNQIIMSFYGFNKKEKKNLIFLKIFDELLIWMYKVRKIGICETNCSTILLQNLFNNLIDQFITLLKKVNINGKNIIWDIFNSLVLIIYEFCIMSNFDKKIINKEINFELIEKNEIISEIIQNLNYDYSKKNNENNNNIINNNDSFEIENEITTKNNFSIKTQNSFHTNIIELWKDKILLNNIYDIYKDFWNDSIYNEKISNSLNLDDLKIIISLVNKKLFDFNENEYANEMNILLYNKTYLNTNFNKIFSNEPITILRCLLNIIMINIRLSDNKDDVTYWVIELEKFILFIIMANQSLVPTNNFYFKINDKFLIKSQNDVLNAIILTNNFLLEEINSPRRKTINNDITNEFKSCLKNLFITFTLISEKILNDMKEKENQKGIYDTLFNFYSKIKNIFFNSVQKTYEYSPILKIYNEYYLTKNQNKLFNLDDISEFRINEYLDFPQKFTEPDYIFALQENTNVNNIIKNHFYFEYFEEIIKIRFKEGDKIKINNEICNKEKNLIYNIFNNVIFIIKNSLEKFENKNIKKCYKLILKKKEFEKDWINFKKEQFTWNGKWSDLYDYFEKINNHQIKYKIANHYAQNLSCPILYNIYDINNYLPEFSKYDKNNLFLNKIENNQIEFNKNENEIDNKIEFIKNVKEEKDNINSNKIYLNDFKKLMVKQYTNKSLIYIKNGIFFEFTDIYSNLQKLKNYFNLYFTSNYNECIINIKEYYLKILNKIYEKNIKQFYNICILKLNGHIKGTFVYTKAYIYFLINYPNNKNIIKCHGSLFLYNSKKHKLIYKIKISDIIHIFKKRYYYKKVGLEIFTNENKSYYFIFENQVDRDEIFKLLSNNSNLSYYPDNLYKIIKDWENWEIDNFSLLNILNHFSGRSYKDITQYPVFPWIIKDYISNDLKEFNNKTIRDLKKPIGAIGSEQRTLLYLEKFNESIENDNNKNSENLDGYYFYSSHYSNAFYVIYYLNRLFPYTNCAIELQGNGFDMFSRQFFSINISFENCMSENTDIREVIPEFYILPEIFKNINNLNLTNEFTGENLDCELPLWSKNNNYLFCLKNKIYLESEFVSYNINNWIDLIFGYKQKGKEAEKSMNLFFRFTYEDGIDIDKIKNENYDEYLSYISKVEMGQTPSQLFLKPFNKRLLKQLSKNNKIIFETFSKLKYFNSTSEYINNTTYKSCKKDLINKMIIYMKCLKNNKILCIFNNGIFKLFKIDNTPYSESGLIFINEKVGYLPSDHMEKLNKNKEIIINIIQEDNDIMKTIENNQPIVSIFNGKIIIKGGYYAGKFLIYSIDNYFTPNYFYMNIDDDCKVTFILIDNIYENYLYIGTNIGRIYLYKIDKDNNKNLKDIFSFINIIEYQTNNINYMYFNYNLNIFASVSNDKTCNLYSYPLNKLYKVIMIDNKTNLDYVFISDSPLPSVILYSKKNNYFYIYSINGNFIKKTKNNFKNLFSPKIIKDNYQRDYLFFGTNEGNLVIRRLPLLENTKIIEIKKNINDNLFLPIKYFDISEDKQTLYYWKMENFNVSAIKCIKENDYQNKEVKLFDDKLNI